MYLQLIEWALVGVRQAKSQAGTPTSTKFDCDPKAELRCSVNQILYHKQNLNVRTIVVYELNNQSNLNTP